MWWRGHGVESRATDRQTDLWLALQLVGQVAAVVALVAAVALLLHGFAFTIG